VNESPDAVFLDVRMPGLDGFGVVREVGPERMPPVVFVTAYDDRAVDAFDAGAVDYLVKPVEKERLAAALERVRQRFERGRGEALEGRLERLLAKAVPEVGHVRHLLAWKDERAQLVPLERVDRIEAERNHSRAHVAGRSFVVRHPLGSLLPRLDPARFVQVNRSNVVRVEAIRELRSWFHGDRKVLLTDGTELLWSRRYRARQKELAIG
jgi:two-component system LytT family response regulator